MNIFKTIYYSYQVFFFKDKNLREKLLHSHISIALAGSLTLVIALSLFVFMGQSSNDLAQVNAPVSISMNKLNAGIQQSLAATRGWIISKNDGFIDERRDAWDLIIEPELEKLNLLVTKDSDNFNDIIKDIVNLRYIQWHIEDIAHTPGNQPAYDLYFSDIEPLHLEIISYLTEFGNHQKLRRISKKEFGLYVTISNIHTNYLKMSNQLLAFLNSGQQHDKIKYYKLLGKLDFFFKSIIKQRHLLSKKEKEIYVNILREYEVFTLLAKKVIKYRDVLNNNVANFVLATQAAPLAKKISTELKQKLLIQSFKIQGNINIVEVLSSVVPILIFLLIILLFLLATHMAAAGADKLLLPINHLVKATSDNSREALKDQIEVIEDDELGVLTKSFNLMRKNLDKILTKEALGQAMLLERKKELEAETWRRSGQNEIGELLQGEPNINNIGEMMIKYLAERMDAQLGAFYNVKNDEKNIENKVFVNRVATYAYPENSNKLTETGNGLILQVIKDRKLKIINKLPAGFVNISSGLTDSKPTELIIFPLILEQEVIGVIELASIQNFSENSITFLDSVNKNISSAIDSFNKRFEITNLLEASRKQIKVTEKQKEEINIKHEELKLQSEELKASQEELKQQSEELQTANEELEEKSTMLERKSFEIVNQNKELLVQTNSIQKQTEQLKLSNKYKSEFLANMSHELRTPLNSLLILSQSLADNDEKNLTGEQVEDALMIHEGGTDLLDLINDILDLSKIEAGKMDVNITDCLTIDIATKMERTFKAVSKNKNVKFDISIDQNCPQSIMSDSGKIEQVLKNFLSNAFKFTSTGLVRLKITKPSSDEIKTTKLEDENSICFHVIDTGIGVDQAKHQSIFEAFQQEDGSTSRQYGGTGLGLSISLELSQLLGGEIKFVSKKHQGSTFSLYLPLNFKAVYNVTDLNIADTSILPIFIADDRNQFTENDRKLLIIEDDKKFCKVLMNLCHLNGYKCLVAGTGALGIELANSYNIVGIILDLGLPDMDGQKVIELLKNNNKTKQIPIHIMSGKREEDITSIQNAVGYIQKPINERDVIKILRSFEKTSGHDIKKVLIVEDDKIGRFAIEKLLKSMMGSELDLLSVDTGKLALKKSQDIDFDCMIVDLTLPDMTGFELLEKFEHLEYFPPTIIYTGRDLSQKEIKCLNKYTDSIVIKGVLSPQRLKDEVGLFLNKMNSQDKNFILNSEKNFVKKIELNADQKSDTVIKNNNYRLLLVDDDLRNTFAVSKVLRNNGFSVEIADNGNFAIEKLQTGLKIDLILMDIMMPEMDGFNTMELIKKDIRFRNIPIIVLSAKAMPDDRAKCFEYGAKDYLTKPLDMTKLLSIINVWVGDTGES